MLAFISFSLMCLPPLLALRGRSKPRPRASLGVNHVFVDYGGHLLADEDWVAWWRVY
jgi:hypothetical protein